MELVHQVTLNMLVTKYFDNKVFYFIDPWGENLASIAWAMRGYYYHTIMAKLCLAIFGRDMLFNLTSGIDWQVATAAK